MPTTEHNDYFLSTIQAAKVISTLKAKLSAQEELLKKLDKLKCLICLVCTVYFYFYGTQSLKT